MIASFLLLAASLPFFEKTLTYSNAELESRLVTLAKSVPGLVRVASLGSTTEGTPIRLVTVTEFASGEKKPGYYIQGHIHSKEMSGTMTACHLIDRLVEGHRPGGILSKMVFYFVPRCNPDGAERMAKQPGNERSGWGEIMDDEGLLEPRDLDGDGVCATMRQECPDGGFVRSPRDPRCLVVRREHPEAPGPFYRLYEEGVFSNWKGRPTTLPYGKCYWRRYLDYNRNWPCGWSAETLGAGHAPLNVPETRLQDAFLRAHTNVCAAITLHNGYGMVITHDVRPEDADRYRTLADRAGEIVGFPVRGIGEWAKGGHSGGFEEYCYGNLGIFCLCIELGTRETSCGLDAREMLKRKDTYTAPYEVLAQQDAHPEYRQAFRPWRKFRHPQLGDVEIGGLDATTLASPLPTDLLRTSDHVFEFLLEHAESLSRPLTFGI